MSAAKILWVDDEIDLLKPHILFLQGKGYDVVTSNNGYDAIDLASSQPFDLIILDEMMPGLTGLETLPRIKELRPMTPVIMVTKSEEENIMDKAVGSKIASSPSRRRPTTAASSVSSPRRSPPRGRSPTGCRYTRSSWAGRSS